MANASDNIWVMWKHLSAMLSSHYGVLIVMVILLAIDFLHSKTTFQLNDIIRYIFGYQLCALSISNIKNGYITELASMQLMQVAEKLNSHEQFVNDCKGFKDTLTIHDIRVAKMEGWVMQMGKMVSYMLYVNRRVSKQEYSEWYREFVKQTMQFEFTTHTDMQKHLQEVVTEMMDKHAMSMRAELKSDILAAVTEALKLNMQKSESPQ